MRYLRVNVNGESHSQQSQRGLSSWERKTFLSDMGIIQGFKTIQSNNTLTHKNITVFSYKP
jgi:hypothetical protein